MHTIIQLVAFIAALAAIVALTDWRWGLLLAAVVTLCVSTYVESRKPKRA